MRLAIMQPYFFPYIGYFHLAAAVEAFIVYDNIKYTKKGWINRNRMLQNGKDVVFTLPLQGAPDSNLVCQRELSSSFNRDKLLDQLAGAYRRAPYFDPTYAVIDPIIRHRDINLFGYLYHSIVTLARHFGLQTAFSSSSAHVIDRELKGQEKVLALCQAAGASTYVNAIGGLALYDPLSFADYGIGLRFVKSRSFEYSQFGAAFVPWLSIIDVMMFNAPEIVRAAIGSGYDLIEAPPDRDDKAGHRASLPI